MVDDLTQHYNQTTGGTWDTGDFNYDGLVDFNDFTLMTRTYNTSLGTQSAPAASATAPAPAAIARGRADSAGSRTMPGRCASAPPRAAGRRDSRPRLFEKLVSCWRKLPYYGNKLYLTWMATKQITRNIALTAHFDRFVRTKITSGRY